MTRTIERRPGGNGTAQETTRRVPTSIPPDLVRELLAERYDIPAILRERIPTPAQSRVRAQPEPPPPGPAVGGGFDG